jgi:formylglycine-generating enzyme required for sulfatase activity
MGSTEAEAADECAHHPGGCTASMRQRLDREQPTREITLSPFYLDIDEVTNEQFAAFLNILGPLAIAVRDDSEKHYPRYVQERSTGLLLIDLSRTTGGIERTADGEHFAARSGRARWPVAQVTWNGASEYCRHLGKRLPTEAEWEYAARGTSRRRFPWGDAAPRCDAVVFGRGNPAGCPGQSSVPDDVGTAPQDVTPEGVRGLGGSVGEWVQDQFLLPYYGDCGDCVDPVAERAVPLTEDFRMFRGGTYDSDPFLSRSSTRSRWKRGEVMTSIGLRCASR